MAEPQLFCFPYAGGSASFYDEIERELPGVALVKPEYAGHGARRDEPFYDGFDDMAEDMLRVLRQRWSGEAYALMGYSMGSIVLAEVLRRIEDGAGLPRPCHAFLAAHEPHTKAELAGFTPQELDEWVKERTIRFGALPERMIGNRVFWRMYLPLFRADYTLISKYRFEDLSLRTEVPLTVFYSETDTPLAEMRKWERYFTGPCEFIRYEGPHFFIQSHHGEMAAVIRARLAAGLGDTTHDL